MDGSRIQQYWSNEMEALLQTYKQFQTLIPSKINNGADHNGEDGRYVETLLKEYLSRYLPKELEVLTGFILRPSVKTGLKGKERKDEIDQHSSQLDLIIYDSYNYPVFQRFGDSVIVPPEGVIAIISIKKTLNDGDIEHEITALKNASDLCKCLDNNNKLVRGPYLALVSMNSNIKKSIEPSEEWIFNRIRATYKALTPKFDDLVGYIGALNEWSIFKRRPDNQSISATYIYFEHQNEESHLGFQFLLTGVLSVYYDQTRNHRRRPGFTAFPSGRNHDKVLGSVQINGLR